MASRKLATNFIVTASCPPSADSTGAHLALSKDTGEHFGPQWLINRAPGFLCFDYLGADAY